MTQEEKQLLLNDLCGRLPYGVKLGLIGAHKKLIGEPIALDVEDYENSNPLILINSNWLPYLRPMSSMTEKEADELYTAMDWYGEIDETGNVYTKGQEKVYRETFYEYTDWLNSHHFDYRGLIPMGLALEAPEDMYKEN